MSAPPATLHGWLVEEANAPGTRHAERRVHIVGAGPVGLMLTALLQTTGTFSIRLYEKRRVALLEKLHIY
jgi:threonine dehydrogenase-like Zn-dependent dehydrogenase